MPPPPPPPPVPAYPPPGQPYPPGYPPPRRGMGCFAKGCLAVVLIFVALGIIAGAGAWFIYTNVRPYVGRAPVAIRTFPATAGQYSELEARIQAFQTGLAAQHRATLALSADDLNVYIARSPTCDGVRGKFYLGIAENQLIVDASVPLSDKKSQRGDRGTVYYFSGKIYCDFSYSDGDFTIVVRKIAPLDGSPPSPFIAAIAANPDFSRSFSQSFNEVFHKTLSRNPAGGAAMAEVRSIVVQNDHLVITAADE